MRNGVWLVPSPAPLRTLGLVDKLQCIVQTYAWGNPTAIPELLGVAPSGEPQAEMWMGAHPKAPSTLTSSGVRLDDHIAANPEGTLGAATAERFGRLPFLFKVLAAGKPLSIQAHPSLAQAQAGFAREDDAGIALDAFTRTYRDDNHKPEMICALTPFVGRCGFRSLDATRSLFTGLAAAQPDSELLAQTNDRLAAEGSGGDVLAGVLAWLLRLSAEDAALLVAATVAAAGSLLTSGASQWPDELPWCARMNDEFPGDVGVVVALLLNHVVLAPGQAFFLGAGNLHAYLDGVGVELMANSDNVVRGGLTPKNIDVEELLAVVDCTPIDPPVQSPDGAVHTFDAPVPEFALTRIELGPNAVDATVIGPEIVIVTSGTAVVEGGNDRVELNQGEVAFIEATDGDYKLFGDGVAFRAAVNAENPC